MDVVALFRTIHPVDEGWIFRQGDDPISSSRRASRFPTNVHLDLLYHHEVSDPFLGQSETDCQWVGDVPWIYRTQFASPNVGHGDVVLAFDGLDTYATVKLNNYEILKTENMFIPERVDVTELLVPQGQNILEIEFASTFLAGKKLLKKYPDHQWGCWNGDPSRLAVRKAQYHYGWDWGPRLLTCGPWKPISLECYSSRISDLYFLTKVHASLESAEIVAKVDIEGSASHVQFDILFEGRIEGTERVEIVDGSATATFRRDHPRLWYPVGYGKQPLYTLQATLLIMQGFELDRYQKRFGLRRARVIEQKLEDAPGSTFVFEINNIPIFCGGSCWIPPESFMPRMTPQKYRDWVRLVVEGNQVMIRVWGGGIYEDQLFYDTCDEMGVLVWQDFLFACGNYPAHDHFLDLVKREATANVKRLRHHPSIVIWAGNNEDYQYCETEDLDYNPSDQNPQNWLRTTFPARFIYEKILKEVTQELIPNTFYHYGSPYGGSSTSDPTVADIHQWNVWHGTQSPYQEFDRLCGRFVSEFGMEAFPNPQTIDSFLPSGSNDPERYAQSSTMDFRNKALGHERRIATYLTENIQYTYKPFEQYIYATQLLQAECLGTAYRLFRRQWKGPGREYCAGALCWQLNDCWPGISWSVADYYLRPKLGYYAVKRELAPITVGTKRITSKSGTSDASQAVADSTWAIEVWASNLTLENLEVRLEARMWDISTGQSKDLHLDQGVFKLLPNRSTELNTIPNPCHNLDVADLYRTVAVICLIDIKTEQKIARAVNWPEPLKYVRFQQPKDMKLKIIGGAIEISAEVPVKAIMLDVPDEEGKQLVVWDDNGFDLIPGEPMRVGVNGLEVGEEHRVTVRYMGSEGECLT